jgi:chromosome segregation ATPase
MFQVLESDVQIPIQADKGRMVNEKALLIEEQESQIEEQGSQIAELEAKLEGQVQANDVLAEQLTESKDTVRELRIELQTFTYENERLNGMITELKSNATNKRKATNPFAVPSVPKKNRSTRRTNPNS